MKKKKVRRLALLLMLFCGIGYVILHFAGPAMIIIPRKHSGNLMAQSEKYGLEVQPFSVAGHGGDSLSAAVVLAPDAKGTVIICHGIGDCKENQLYLAQKLGERHFNAVVFDMRAHGQSQGEYCTYGFFEKHDIAFLLDELEQRGLDNFAIWGTSLGGAIALQALEFDDRLDRAVVISTFSHFRTVVNQYQKRLSGIGWQWLSDFSVWRAETMSGMDAEDVNPVEWLDKGENPVFLIHGTKDIHIPVDHAERLCASLGERGECHFIEGAQHGNAWSMSGQIVKEAAFDFLEAN